MQFCFMSLKEYYNQTFQSDLVSLLRGFPPAEARIFYLGQTWMQGCSLLPRVPAERRPQFLGCLYFTVLVDQAMHTYFPFEHRRFEELTLYPKFRVGLGHPAYLNPVLVFEVPIHHHLVSEEEVRQVIPEAMRLFVDETGSFFRDHMPEIRAQDFFERLLADPDVVGGQRRAVAIDAAGEKPVSFHDLLVNELSKAISDAKPRA